MQTALAAAAARASQPIGGIPPFPAGDEPSFYRPTDSKQAGRRRPTTVNRRRPAAAKPVPQKPYIGRNCPICVETFTIWSDVVFCRTSCGQTVHTGCLALSKFCPSCRAVMPPITTTPMPTKPPPKPRVRRQPTTTPTPTQPPTSGWFPTPNTAGSILPTVNAAAVRPATTAEAKIRPVRRPVAMKVERRPPISRPIRNRPTTTRLPPSTTTAEPVPMAVEPDRFLRRNTGGSGSNNRQRHHRPANQVFSWSALRSSAAASSSLSSAPFSSSYPAPSATTTNNEDVEMRY